MEKENKAKDSDYHENLMEIIADSVKFAHWCNFSEIKITLEDDGFMVTGKTKPGAAIVKRNNYNY